MISLPNRYYTEPEMETNQSARAEQYAKLYTMLHLREMLSNERAALKRQRTHLAAIGGGSEVGAATLAAIRETIAALQSAIDLKYTMAARG